MFPLLLRPLREILLDREFVMAFHPYKIQVVDQRVQLILDGGPKGSPALIQRSDVGPRTRTRKNWGSVHGHLPKNRVQKKISDGEL